MKILYIQLKNFASIYTAMKKKTIEIDFTKSKNRIILLVGDNGTGKTSLLSAFHPFAYPGNMDIRSGGELILDEQDGYKEIHLLDSGDSYVIKHHYLYTKNGRSIKSFINKNGVELNPNGNVTSFKEIIQMELSLELDYLKLIRLGSNVTNFMDMKYAERKNFTSDLLSDIDTYSQFYKKINDDSRFLKAVMKSVSDKIDRLKILDEKDIENKIDNLEVELVSLKGKKTDFDGEVGRINGAIETLIPEGAETFLSQLKINDLKLSELNLEIMKKIQKLKKFDIIILGDIEDEISEITKDITKNENQKSMNINMINFYFTQLNSFYSQKEERENNLKYITSELEYSKLNDMYLELHREKEKLDKNYKDYTPKCTKEDMLAAINILQQIDKFIDGIYSYDHEAVTRVINYQLGGTNVESIVKREVLSIDDKLQKNNIELSRISNTTGTDDGIYVLFKPADCKCDNCPYIKFYEDHVNAKTNSPIEKLKAEMQKLENKREFFLSMLDINKNIDFIFLLIKTNKVLIEKLPENFFDIKQILNAIKDVIPVYDEDRITNYIAILEEYEHYQILKEKIKDVKKELTFIEKNMNTLTTMQNELSNIDNEIFKLETQIAVLKKQNEKLTTKNETLEELKTSYEAYKELSDEIDCNYKEAELLEKSINERRGIESKIVELLKNRKLFEIESQEVQKKIGNVEEEINDNKFSLKEFQSLSHERDTLTEKFDDISVLKEALSSNKGIPLLFIQLYLKNSKIYINNLLNAIFKGDLEVDDFVINDKEFRIPFIKNGIKIPDVSFSSQGEKSFISVALSFALIMQSIKKYNIMLLDEIDGPLDIKNRPMFIKILEEQLDSIDAEQVFLITHNNMFDNYPVDLIMTSDVEIDNYKHNNVIFKAL